MLKKRIRRVPLFFCSEISRFPDVCGVTASNSADVDRLQCLFWKDEGLPWIMRVKCELPTRELRANGTEYPVKAAFVAFGQGGMLGKARREKTEVPEANTHPLYAEFVRAMEQIDIYDCRAIRSPPRPGAELHWGDKVSCRATHTAVASC